ncbi:hypothetical protein ACFFNY_11440 [Paenibacillus hodogayensis]|uniref:Phage portal protein n=1 Tax=Paenibacillus hodogayensis TaxID=279208 RepID=A0ABV5VV23_9BACL
MDPIRRKLWSQAIWVGPSPGQIDPLKKVEASERKIANGFSTHEKETAELTGMDWDSNVDVLEREWEREGKLPTIPNNSAPKGGEQTNANGERN